MIHCGPIENDAKRITIYLIHQEISGTKNLSRIHMRSFGSSLRIIVGNWLGICRGGPIVTIWKLITGLGSIEDPFVVHRKSMWESTIHLLKINQRSIAALS